MQKMENNRIKIEIRMEVPEEYRDYIDNKKWERFLLNRVIHATDDIVNAIRPTGEDSVDDYKELAKLTRLVYNSDMEAKVVLTHG